MTLVLTLLGAGVAAGVAWAALRVRALPQRDAWTRAASQMGLVVGRDGRTARGVVGGHRLEASRGELRLLGPAPFEAERADALRRTLAGAMALEQAERLAVVADPRVAWVLADPVACRSALGALEAEPSATLVLEGEDLRSLVHTATWIGDRLGWAADPEQALLDVATGDADPDARLRAWERLLGGWVPTGQHGPNVLGLAAVAVADADPRIATLGALHLGDGGLDVLRLSAMAPEHGPELVARALRGVWDALHPDELLVLLDRYDHDEVVTRTCWGLARHADGRTIATLRRHARRPGPSGKTVRDTIATIEGRLAHTRGGLDLVNTAGGTLTTPRETS